MCGQSVICIIKTTDLSLNTTAVSERNEIASAVPLLVVQTEKGLILESTEALDDLPHQSNEH